MSSKDRVWREGDDKWTWAEEESVPRYMWSQVHKSDVVNILNLTQELEKQLEAVQPVIELYFEGCDSDTFDDAMLSLRSALQGEKE